MTGYATMYLRNTVRNGPRAEMDDESIAAFFTTIIQEFGIDSQGDYAFITVTKKARVNHRGRVYKIRADSSVIDEFVMADLCNDVNALSRGRVVNKREYSRCISN
jgi:hypothetical protein